MSAGARARGAVGRIALAIGLAAGVFGGGLLGVGAASATPPVPLDSGAVTDFAGVLTEAELERADERLDETYRETGVDLFVVFVDEFTDPSDSNDWTNDTADLNGLGASQYLLGVSTEGRQYYISGLDGGDLSDDFLGQIEEEIRPELRGEDWIGAIETAAALIEEGESGGGSESGEGSFAADAMTGIGVFLLIALGIAAVIVLIVVIVKRRKRGAERRLREQSLAELERDAGVALVRADDALKTSAEELEFARAQFGDESVTEFAETIAAAGAGLEQAFALKQQLDDEIPDTEEQRREWNLQIAELCAQAEARLDEKAAAFDELRKLEQNAPAALAALESARARAGGAEALAQKLHSLRAGYAEEALATVAETPALVAARLAFTDQEIARARQSVDAGASAAAAVSIRAAEQSLAQAEALAQALTAHEAELQAAGERANALIAELRNDIATARGLPDPQGAVAAAVQATERRIGEARGDLEGDRRHPERAERALEDANAHIDGVVEQASGLARAQQLLDAQLAQARDRILQTDNYIASRRGAIGATARTRIAEAQQALARAEAARAQQDVTTAQGEVQRAVQLAAAALQAAENDVNGFSPPQGGYPRGAAGGSGSSGGGDVLAAVLGGILLGGMGGGGGSRGSRSSRGGFGGGGGGRRSGGFSAGSFGGSGTRSRRGGGRF
ncbi:TPM domain-containing protein [Leucobacter weissii]|uniref:TPM domain-containing protein n=1 Tax=Leucobacter weissii TaxID=1983706 RepID=A0A939MIJ5_9MICO|nr:TPM domain-containing protein [Leucobacter weissii]MBO1900890.1 TPM domain-containing protein [Leucobacter weissii]